MPMVNETMVNENRKKESLRERLMYPFVLWLLAIVVFYLIYLIAHGYDCVPTIPRQCYRPICVWGNKRLMGSPKKIDPGNFLTFINGQIDVIDVEVKRVVHYTPNIVQESLESCACYNNDHTGDLVKCNTYFNTSRQCLAENTNWCCCECKKNVFAAEPLHGGECPTQYMCPAHSYECVVKRPFLKCYRRVYNRGTVIVDIEDVTNQKVYEGVEIQCKRGSGCSATYSDHWTDSIWVEDQASVNGCVDNPTCKKESRRKHFPMGIAFEFQCESTDSICNVIKVGHTFKVPQLYGVVYWNGFPSAYDVALPPRCSKTTLALVVTLVPIGLALLCICPVLLCTHSKASHQTADVSPEIKVEKSETDDESYYNTVDESDQ